MKKGIKTISIAIIVLLLSVTFFDLHILRGYFLIPYIYQDTFKNFDGRFEYEITENANGTFDLHLKNRDIAYYPIILYRSDIFFNLDDSTVFQYAERVKFFNNDSTIYDTGGGFDCGTGLSYALIRPFESFELKNVKPSDLVPLLEFYIDEMKEMGLNLKDHDTLNCQFYLPIFSFGDEETRIYSNKIGLKIALSNDYVVTQTTLQDAKQ